MSQDENVSETFLELLRCPACRGGLANAGSRLTCTECQRSFPVEDGIPHLVIDEAVDAQSKGDPS